MLPDDASLRRKHNRDTERETRGPKLIFGRKEWEILDDFIESNGFEGRVYGYEEIMKEVLPYLYKEYLKLSLKTIQRSFHNQGYHKCVACQKSWLSQATIRERREYLYLRQHWTQEQWRKVRFSDKVHLGQGPRRKLKVIRKQGERYHPSCIQKTATPSKIKNKNTKRYHVWAAIGYGFKSRLIFYETHSPNGKLTQDVYLNKILKEEVQIWLDKGDDFILEQDQDSGHGPAQNNNSVRAWKESVGLNYFFNTSGSPDLAPIENVWRAQKQKINDFDHFDDATLLEGIYRAWDSIPQSAIDRYVDSMRDRMKSLARRDGDVTEY